MDYIEGFVEMVAGSDVKHVFDEKENKLKVHRKTALPLPEPFNYGFIKGTMSEDGDPLDVFIMSDSKIELWATVKLKPIGMFYVKDEMGVDNKIIAVPEGDSAYADISDIGRKHLDNLIYLLEHNKDGMPGRWTKVSGMSGRESAMQEIERASRANES
jgi:inorganic pyrophosphatase